MTISIPKFKELIFEELEKNESLDSHSLFYLRYILVKHLFSVSILDGNTTFENQISLIFNNITIVLELHPDRLYIFNSLSDSIHFHTELKLFFIIKDIIEKINVKLFETFLKKNT